MVAASTIDARLPDLVDGFFASNPLAARLLQRDHVKEDGGDKIRQPLIYDKLPGGSYRGMDTFDVSKKNVITELVFDWKQYYVNVTLDGLTLLKNAGAKKVFDVVNAQMDIAKLSASEYVGVDMFLDGTGNGGKALTGLRAAVDNGDTVATYGGITRSSTVGDPGNACRGNVNVTGGAFSLAFMNTEFNTAVIGNEKPDLILTTQTIWNKWWERAQPAQRFQAGDSRSNMAKIGFSGIEMNGADVVVDSHVPSGFVYFLNTKWMKFIVHSSRLWTPTGWKYPTNQDAAIQQLLLACELVCQAPRLQALTTTVA